MSLPAFIVERDGCAEVSVRLTPRAAKDEIAGSRAGRLAVRVSAPPVEGRANEALRKLVAKRCGVARSRVTVVRGERSRDKLIRIEGVSAAAATGRLR